MAADRGANFAAHSMDDDLLGSEATVEIAKLKAILAASSSKLTDEVPESDFMLKSSAAKCLARFTEEMAKTETMLLRLSEQNKSGKENIEKSPISMATKTNSLASLTKFSDEEGTILNKCLQPESLSNEVVTGNNYLLQSYQGRLPSSPVAMKWLQSVDLVAERNRINEAVEEGSKRSSEKSKVNASTECIKVPLVNAATSTDATLLSKGGNVRKQRSESTGRVGSLKAGARQNHLLRITSLTNVLFDPIKRNKDHSGNVEPKINHLKHLLNQKNSQVERLEAVNSELKKDNKQKSSNLKQSVGELKREVQQGEQNQGVLLLALRHLLRQFDHVLLKMHQVQDVLGSTGVLSQEECDIIARFVRRTNMATETKLEGIMSALSFQQITQSSVSQLRESKVHIPAENEEIPQRSSSQETEYDQSEKVIDVIGIDDGREDGRLSIIARERIEPRQSRRRRRSLSTQQSTSGQRGSHTQHQKACRVPSTIWELMTEDN